MGEEQGQSDDFPMPIKGKKIDEYDGSQTMGVSTYAPTEDDGIESRCSADFSMSMKTSDFRNDPSASQSIGDFSAFKKANKLVSFAEEAEVSPAERGEMNTGTMIPAEMLPSLGSKFHGTGQCKPCAWYHKSQGCENGKDCNHCHLCQE